MIGALERAFLALALLALVLLGAAVLLDLALRVTTGTGLAAATALEQELLVAVIALPMASATTARAHATITLFSDRLDATAQARLILGGHILSLLVALGLIVATLRFASDAPAGPGAWILLVGLSLMALRLALMLIADLRQFRETGFIDGDNGQGAV